MAKMKDCMNVENIGNKSLNCTGCSSFVKLENGTYNCSHILIEFWEDMVSPDKNGDWLCPICDEFNTKEKNDCTYVICTSCGLNFIKEGGLDHEKTL